MATTQITKNGVTKDIHDRRLPTTIGTEGQILQVNNQGQIVWNDAPEGSVTNVKVDGTSVVTEGVAEIDLGDFSITATAEELNVLDGITATTEELNYTDGVTSAIQPQLNTLDTRITNLQNIGRFLSILDAANGTVSSQPTGSVGDTYAYKVGDYYRIGTAGTYTPKNTLTFTIDATSGSSNFEQGTITYSIGDVIYCSNVGESATTWVKQASSGGGTVQDVQINSQSLVSGGIATIPIASTSGPGVIKYTQGQGLSMAADKSLYVVYAVPAEIEAKTNKRNCITPGYLDKAVMEGLGNNSLTWSDAYKSSARATIGAISASEVPVELPVVSSEDNGKFLRVVNGVWASATIENASGGSY